MKKALFSFTIITTSILLSSCQKDVNIKPNIQENSNEGSIEPRNEITVKVLCNKGTIQSYLDSGWRVIDRKEKDITCSWKTIQATKGCNLEKDKGCRITVPDKKGKETIYTLTRD